MYLLILLSFTLNTSAHDACNASSIQPKKNIIIEKINWGPSYPKSHIQTMDEDYVVPLTQIGIIQVTLLLEPFALHHWQFIHSQRKTWKCSLDKSSGKSATMEVYSLQPTNVNASASSRNGFFQKTFNHGQVKKFPQSRRFSVARKLKLGEFKSRSAGKVRGIFPYMWWRIHSSQLNITIFF